MTFRNWCITVNICLPEENEDAHDCLHPSEWGDLVRYFCWQLEAGDETGHPHYQCYLETTRAVRLSAIKKLVGLERAHIERRIKSRDAARDYCMKTESRLEGPWEYGDWNATGQGNRTDVAEMTTLVKEGKSDRDIIEMMPSTFVRYFRAIDRIRLIYAKPRDFKTRVYFIYGSSGWGKSRLAGELLPDAFWKQPHSIWWDGYAGGDVIIDDFKGWLPYADLLRLLDRYPLQVQTKGGQSAFAPQHLVLTASIIPQLWYDSTKVKFNWTEFSRRVDVWIHFTAEGVCEEIDAAKFYELYVFHV